MIHIFLFLFISLPAPAEDSDLPFLRSGEYEVVSGPEEGCLPSLVEFDREKKILRIGALYNILVENKKSQAPSEGAPDCLVSEERSFSREKDHSRILQAWSEVCPKTKTLTRDEVSVFRERIELKETVNEKSFRCVWKRIP